MQQQFELVQQRATLIHINPRPEKHGDENVPAADLKIEVTDGNELLSMFHPSFRNFLYKKDESEGQLEGMEHMTVRRFGGLIERLRLDYSLKGAEVTIGFGLGGQSDINFETVDVDSFNVTIMEGGSVGLTFRIKAKPTGEQIKKLYEIMGGEIDVWVKPAEEKQGSLGLPMPMEA